VADLSYAELHCHSHFSFLDGASAPDDLVARAMELGLAGLAITDHQGLYGAVRFSTAAEAAGLHPVIGIEVELADAAVADPGGLVVPARRAWRPGRKVRAVRDDPRVIDGLPARPRPERTRLPGHRRVVKEDHRGIGEGQRGPHLLLLARDATGWRSLCRMTSRANLAGSKAVPVFTQALLADNAEGVIALSGCREGELARRLRAGDREGARAVAERYAALFGGGFFLELSHHLLPDDDWLASETARLAAELGLPCVVTNDVHYALPEGRELQDIVTAIRHGRSLGELAELRRPDGESYLKSAGELLALPPGEPSTAVADPVLARAWREGIAASASIAASCRVELAFERYRFPGFPVPKGQTPFSHLSELCWEGARRRYHPLTPAVVKQLAHELDVIQSTGLAEFFLICWDLMRFAKSRHIPAQGRGSAADSIVAYVLGITRVDPIRHELLFERFINEGRTAYPDVDIDFSSERREEVIQYVYERYGTEHTGMVCNLVTYRARSAVREVGYALGFPRPLVDRVAKALETYDSVMVRRDLEAEGGFAQFFARPEEHDPVAAEVAVLTAERGLTDPMGQLNHERGGRFGGSAGAERGDGRMARVEDERRLSGDRRGEPPRPERWLGGDEADRWLRDQVGVFAPGSERPTADPGLGGSSVGRRWRERDPRPPAATPGRPAATPEPATPPVIVSCANPAEPEAQGPRTSPGPAVNARSEPVGVRALRAGGVPTAVGPAPDGAWDAATPGNAHATITPGTRTWEGALGTKTWEGAPGTRTWEGAPGTRTWEAPGTGTWEGAPGSRPATRRGHGPDDEGGPGDSTASVAWLRAGRGTGYGTEGWAPYREIARQIDPETGVLRPDDRRYDPRQDRRIDDHLDLPVGGPSALDRPIDRHTADDGGGPGDESAAARRWAREQALARQEPHSSVARVEPAPPTAAHSGSVARLSDWERWLELCARIDGFPRHLSIHSGGMLVTAAPLIDIAPIERATMKDRVVVQFDKRDVETMKLIKLDLLGLGMLAAIDECVQLIEHDCAVCLDLDRIPEEIPEVFEMLQAADTVGVFQVESRAQMQTLPKSRPQSLDDLVVEVAIIRPGPIQGNAVHPYLRRKQGLEPVTYLHPSLEPILHDTLGVILYQEQVMKIAIDVAGFTPAGSDGFRRAMGTWRSTREMEKLHAQFVDGCVDRSGMARDDAEELFRRCAAFASFGFAKSHAAAFARTAYESSFLKLFYPAQFSVGLINAQPMGFYPVEVLVNDAKRHGVAVLPVDVNRSSYRTTTEWVGRPGWAMAATDGDDGSHDGDEGEPLPEGCGIDARPAPVRSPACIIPRASERDRWAAETMTGWGIRLGLHLVKGIGEEQQARLDEELARGPYTSLADVVERSGLAEEVVERLIRVGALDSLGRPRRELLWQLREVAGASKGRVDGKARSTKGITRAAGRPMDLRLPATDAPALPPLSEPERLGDAYAVVGLDARRQAVSLFRPALEQLGAVPNGDLNGMRPGPVRLGGLVVTRQHPMTARGTVFLALEDETGMVNVTLWPDTWQRLRSVVRRHALLLVDGDLQREGEVVNVIARSVRPLVEAASGAGGPEAPSGVRQIGQAGMRRLG
jgi:DNA polymerase III alpha subunit